MKSIEGVKNCYFATYTVSDVDGSVTFDAPERMEGLKNVQVTETFAEAKNFADNICITNIKKITGADITLDFANVSRKIEAALTGKKYVAGAMETKSNDVQAKVAILYEITYDDGSSDRVVYYNAALTRAGNGAQTKTDTITFTDVQFSGAAIPLVINGEEKVNLVLSSDEIEAAVTAADPSATDMKDLYDNFFTTVAVLPTTP